jgi:hypothetical protein
MSLWRVRYPLIGLPAFVHCFHTEVTEPFIDFLLFDEGIARNGLKDAEVVRREPACAQEPAPQGF